MNLAYIYLTFYEIKNFNYLNLKNYQKNVNPLEEF